MIKRIIDFLKKDNTRCICEKSEEFLKYSCNDGIIVDVRSPQEFNEGHIDNAILIPDYEVYVKSRELLKDKKQKIFLYCNTGARSEKVKKILKKQGYENVYNICKKVD